MKTDTPAVLFVCAVLTTLTSTCGQSTAKQTACPSPAANPVYKTTIYFSADDDATLYHNGKAIQAVSNFQQTASKTITTKEGDTISIKARDYRFGYGVIAQMSFNGRTIVTGRTSDGWKASPKFPTEKPDAWMAPSFSTCDWKDPILSDDPVLNMSGLRTAEYFPKRAGAQYVWARGAVVAKYPNVMFLRYVVGGEACALPLVFAAGKTGFLFVNGEFKNALYNDFTTVSRNLRLRNGDVVALRVQGYQDWYGALFAMGPYITGVYPNWRAVKKFSMPGDAFSWMYPEYDACSWPRAVAVDDVPDLLEPFPFKTGAKVVRAVGTALGDPIYLRVRIGGGC